jgi:hypothetical protein
MEHPSVSPEMQTCIQHCLDCHRICLETVMNERLPNGNTDVGQEHLRLMMTCAEICQTCANFMLSGSEQHSLICGVCADICRRCAANCQKVGGLEECVQACETCACSCEKLAAS